jgi:putative transcriptional regulator
MSFAGSFLVARPVLRDPTFFQTVVLLLAHTDDGAFGLVVNRPTTVEGWPFPVFGGGPCPSPGLILLHGHAEWVAEGGSKQEIAPGIFVGDPTVLERATEAESTEAVRLRAFLGYSGWGSGQLENELAAGAWAVIPATGELLFGAPVEELWERLAPPNIPQPSMN